MLISFTAEDAGFIDNVLSDSPLGQLSPGEGTFTNADRVAEDVNEAHTKGARAGLRWDVTDDVDVTLTGLVQDLEAGGHGDVNLGVGDLNQVRFENENLKDNWYQLALTLNASTSFGDLILSVQQDGKDPIDVVDMGIDDVVKMIRGPKGTVVTLRVPSEMRRQMIQRPDDLSRITDALTQHLGVALSIRFEVAEGAPAAPPAEEDRTPLDHEELRLELKTMFNAVPEE
jgi:hypothetical protein